MIRNTANPDPDLFTTYERVETCHRVEVTEDNIAALAKHFGWSVDYAEKEARLLKRGGNVIRLGSWVDERGSRWNAESPLVQGWSPAHTFRERVAR